MTPSSTISCSPPRADATIGRATWAACSATNPNNSWSRDGITTTDADCRSRGISSGETHPRNSTASATPSAFACRSSADRAGPSPAMTNRSAGRPDRNLANAPIARSKPFCVSSRPTHTIRAAPVEGGTGSSVGSGSEFRITDDRSSIAGSGRSVAAERRLGGGDQPPGGQDRGADGRHRTLIDGDDRLLQGRPPRLPGSHRTSAGAAAGRRRRAGRGRHPERMRPCSATPIASHGGCHQRRRHRSAPSGRTGEPPRRRGLYRRAAPTRP